MTPVAYNTLGAGLTRRVHGKWVAYHDGGGWRSIDSSFRDDGSAFVSDYGPMRFSVPQFSHETATLEINNRWDIWGRSFISSPAMVFEITPEDVLSGIAGRIDGDNPSQVWFDDAWGPGLSLRYTVWHGRAPRATREIVVDPARCPRGRDLQASWLVRSPNALTLIDGARPKNPDGSDWTGTPGDRADLPVSGASIHYFDGQVDPVRGSGFKGPRIWYWRDIDPITGQGTLVSQPAQVTAEIVTADAIRLTKLVPQSLVDVAAAEGSLLITDDVQTIYPDPNAETTTWDGHALYSGGPFTTALVGPGNGTDTHTPAYLGWNQSGGGGEKLERFFNLFDVSSLAGQTVTGVTHGVFTHASASPAYFRVTGAVTASNTGLTATDYYNTYANMDDDYITAIQLSPAGSYYTPAYNSTGIAAVQAAVDGTGIFKSCWRQDEDRIGSTSATQSFDRMQMRTAEYAGTSSDPYLEVTYGAAGGGVFSSRCSYSLGMTLR